MATNQEVSQRLKNLIDILPPVRVIDADTVADREGPVRFKGLNAPEVMHITPDGYKKADWGGEFYTDLFI